MHMSTHLYESITDIYVACVSYQRIWKFTHESIVRILVLMLNIMPYISMGVLHMKVSLVYIDNDTHSLSLSLSLSLTHTHTHTHTHTLPLTHTNFSLILFYVIDIEYHAISISISLLLTVNII